MARTTIAGAATELFDALSTDSAGAPEASLSSAGVIRVYPRDPGAGGVLKPAAVTIQFAGWTPTEWRFTVRIYVADVADIVAQDRLIGIVAATDALLRDAVGFGPSEGEVGWSDEIGSWVAISEVMVGREDGF